MPTTAVLHAGAVPRSQVILLLVFLAGLWAPSVVAAASSTEVAASFSGTFAITDDLGASGVFVVEEAGDGVEQTGLGAFTYATMVRQNLARPPSGCSSGSSTGVGGAGTLTFADGQLQIHRTQGTVCFAFPIIRVEEQWVIAGGTGSYLGATGRLTRVLTGDVRFGTAQGELHGTLRRNDR